MTVTTDDTGVPVASPPSTETAHDQAVKAVDELRASLHRAAREGKLNTEVADGIAFSFIAANAALDDTRVLIAFATFIEDAAKERRADPRQDWDNPMGQSNVPSSDEVVLLKREDIVAARIAESLVSGPWPLFF